MAQPQRVLLISLGAALAEQRKERGITQEELSLATGVHRNYVGGIERGERSPSVARIAILADALGITLGELFTRAESR
jgi:transcriptional regulator with XRE-family HTH domain